MEFNQYCQKAFSTHTKKNKNNVVRKIGKPGYSPPIIQEPLNGRTLLKSKANDDLKFVRGFLQTQEIISNLNAKKQIKETPFLEGETISRKILTRRKR